MNYLLRSIRLALITVNAVVFAGTSLAQSYPSKTIRWIIPYPPGGGTDVISRTLAHKLAEAWGQQIVADNRPGSSGVIGLDAAVKAPPDGYTIVLAQLSNVGLAPGFYPNLPYDPQKDLAPVTLVLSTPFVVIAHPSVPARNTKELIALARAKPDALSFGSSGNGSFSHLAGEMIKTLANVRLLHVPYKGIALAMADLFSGRIELYISPIPPTLPWVKAGRVKALGVTSAKRSNAFPNVPTIAESGLPGYEASNWYGVMVPVKTPTDIVTKLHTEIVRILQLPDVKSRFQDEGGDISPTTPEQFAAFIRSEIPKWTKTIKEASAQVD